MIGKMFTHFQFFLFMLFPPTILIINVCCYFLVILLPAVASRNREEVKKIEDEIFSPGFSNIGERLVSRYFDREKPSDDLNPLKDLNPIFLMQVPVSTLLSILASRQIKYSDSEEMKIIENFYMPFSWDERHYSPAFGELTNSIRPKYGRIFLQHLLNRSSSILGRQRDFGECFISFKQQNVINKVTFTDFPSSLSWNMTDYLDFKSPFYRSFAQGFKNETISMAEVQFWGPLRLSDVNQIVCPCNAFKSLIGNPVLGRSGARIGCNHRDFDQVNSTISDLLKIEVLFGERNEGLMETLVTESDDAFNLLQMQAKKDIESYQKANSF